MTASPKAYVALLHCKNSFHGEQEGLVGKPPIYAFTACKIHENILIHMVSVYN